jgi:hypothetical protein
MDVSNLDMLSSADTWLRKVLMKLKNDVLDY